MGGATGWNPAGWRARWLRQAGRLLDRIDAGLVRGTLYGTLPDGTRRKLGGRAPGFECAVTLHDWRGLLRVALGGSVGCIRRGKRANGRAMTRSACSRCLSIMRVRWGTLRGQKDLALGGARRCTALNRNTKAQAERNIHAHYDLGNDFYAAWLDPTMSYSSAYALTGVDLEAGQHRKWERLAERLGTPASLLEIGCGWGALSGHFASQGAQVTAISLSDAQLDWARQRHPGVQFLKQDYRDTSGQFDAVVSVEMVEALGREYWPAFMDCLARNLKPGGRAAIQFIAMRDDLFDAYAKSADFIQAYVFPGGMLIRTSEFRRLAEARGLAWTEQEDFGLDYAETLRIWRAKFEAAAAKTACPPASTGDSVTSGGST